MITMVIVVISQDGNETAEREKKNSFEKVDYVSWEYAEFTMMKFNQRRILLIDKKFYAVEMDPLHRRVESKHSGQHHNCEDK